MRIALVRPLWASEIGQGARPVAVAMAQPLLGALVPVRTEEGSKLQLDQLLQAVAGASLAISSPALMPSSSEASTGAAQWCLGMVRLLEVILKSGKRACPPFAASAVESIAWGGGGGGIPPLLGTPAAYHH
jgi:hypothetical protein